MTYKDYINLGFTRTDMTDNVELEKYGYGGFALEKVLSDKLTISVYWTELDKPKLYIKKRDRDSCHILPMTGEMVRDWLGKEKEALNMDTFTQYA